MTLSASRKCIEILSYMSWPGIGVARARSLMRALKPGQSVLEAAYALDPGRAHHPVDPQLGIPAKVAELLNECENHSVAVLCMLDDSYPKRLTEIADAPPILYVRGSIPVLAMRSIAVVGTRKTSDAGVSAAHLIAEYVARSGCSVVSGLALGIDTAAHNGALSVGGVTLAVMAHGLDTVAPSSNRYLAERIISSGGALVSEHPPGIPPRPPEFARRNRIQSGLSEASIIVESGAKGGSIIQAKFTHDQGRTLCVVLSNDPDHNREGAHKLIREYGAKPIRRPSEIAELLNERPIEIISHDNQEQAQMELEL